ncbi:glycosyltransferase [Candidatus Woesearchaeota archaeon]|nr:glycosyltransferase [Candidatus Woesearchaeota archaeon]
MISIVIPCFNEEKYLPQLLKSIKNQTFKNYEIIVADNDSTDNSRQIARKYGCRIVSGGLPGKGRFNGGKAADHDIIFFDADVLIKKDFLERFLFFIEKYDLDIATCTVRPLCSKLSHKLFYFLKNLFVYLTHNIYPHAQGQCIFVKKSIFKKTRYDTSMKHGDEHDFVYRATKHGKFKFITRLCVYNYCRRIQKEGFFRLLFKSIYPELLRIIGYDLSKTVVDYEWGKF